MARKRIRFRISDSRRNRRLEVLDETPVTTSTTDPSDPSEAADDAATETAPPAQTPPPHRTRPDAMPLTTKMSRPTYLVGTPRMPSMTVTPGAESVPGTATATPGSNATALSPESLAKEEIPLSTNLDIKVNLLKAVFRQSTDVVFHPFSLYNGQDGMLIYIDGVCDTKQIGQGILDPLSGTLDDPDKLYRPITIHHLARHHLTIPNTKQITTYKKVIEQVLAQQAVLLLEGDAVALSVSVAGGEERGVEEPGTEAVIRGPREGFTESIGTNVALLRKRLRTPDFQVEMMQIGTYTNTRVALCYIHGIASEAIVDEVRTRLERIKIDGVLESGYIEELIEDAPYSPFPQLQNTERPDVTTGLLLEGSVAVLTDGTPFAILGPANLFSALQSAEDYYERYIVSTLVRWLRYLFLGMALFLPATYVAVTTFHQEMLPTKLLLSVAAAREVTPLPAVVEALLMEVTFEALREAGVRLPKTVGSAISIVGALVIGQAAVQAGIASAPMVIVVSITGIASFTIPRYNFALSLRMLRFPMIILAGTLGLYGIVIGLIGVVVHITGLRSFGVPYTQPVSPLKLNNLKDILIRVPHWAMQKRPWQTAKLNYQRSSIATEPNNRVPNDPPSRKKRR